MSVVETNGSTRFSDVVKRIERKNTKHELARALAQVREIYCRMDNRGQDQRAADELEDILLRVLW